MPLFYQEIEKYVGKSRDPDARAYALRSEDGEVSAHVFTNRETYTIAWYGQIEFDDMLFNRIISRDLPKLFFEDGPNAYWSGRALETLSVSLIIHEAEVTVPPVPSTGIELPQSNPRIERHRFVNHEIGSRYPLLPEHIGIDKISFARIDYDFALEMWHANPSFTAENPRSRPSGKAELALKFPRTYRCSPYLLTFMAETIRSGKNLSGYDYLLAEDLAEQFNRILHSDNYRMLH